MQEKKLALITGCSSGLGFAMACTLAESGFVVFATMRALDKADKLVSSCKKPENLRIRKLDVTQNDDIQKVLDEISNEFSRLDVLVHNASQGLIGPVDSASDEEVRSLFETNVFGAISITQGALPIMRNTRMGRIIFISSISGVESAGYQGIYCATKFATEGIAASLATTLHKWNIKVSVVQPGAMNTTLPDKVKIGSRYDSTFDPYKKMNQSSFQMLKDILGRGSSPKTVSEMILQDVIINSEPDFRYQTCDFSKDLVRKHLTDPKGNTWVKEHQKFIDSLS